MWRGTTKISLMERKSIGEVLGTAQEPKQTIKTIQIKRIKIFVHVIRRNKFIINIMEEKINVKKD